jgi:hypothetical protein
VVGKAFAAGIVALIVLLGGCSIACTTVGCSSGAAVLVTMPLPAPYSNFTTCIDHHCAQQRTATGPVDDFLASVSAPYQSERTVMVSILITGEDGSVLAKSAIKTRLHQIQPNGSLCGPTCYITQLKLTASGKLQPK